MSRYRFAIFVFLLSVMSLLLYGKTLVQPFVQDDWTVLHELQSNSAGRFVADAFSPEGRILYRPLAMVYYLLVFTVFGPNPLPFHVIALLVHIANASLAAWTVHRLTGRTWLPAAVGILYAASATVHADTLLWVVGFYDLGAMMLFLLSFILYLQRRPALSAIVYLLALLTKEAAAPAVLVFAVYALLFDRPRLRWLWGHVAVLAAYAVLRLVGSNAAAMDPGHPYMMQVTGMHVISNAGLFLSWACEALVPFWSPSPRLAATLAAFIVAIAAFVVVARDIRLDPGSIRKAIFFVAWMVLGVTPVLPLAHHLSRYYAVSSLVPMLALVVLSAATIMPEQARRSAGVILALFLLFNVAGNWIWLEHRFESEPGSVAVFDGTNHLVRKGAAVEAARTQMLRHFPTLPENAHLVLSGIEVEAFGTEYGPQFWYADTTLAVLTAGEYDSLNGLGALDGKSVVFMRFAADTITRAP